MALKTAVSQLQELLTRRGIVPPQYELIKDEGTPHEHKFYMQVSAADVTAIGIARSKQLAKQEAAKEALKLLGVPFGPGIEVNNPMDQSTAETSLPILLDRTVITRDQNQISGVKDLQELCMRYGLPSPEYTNEISAGPPHHKIFSITCQLIGSLRTEAVAHTKKQAKQQAAYAMYKILTNIKEFQLGDEITVEDIHKNPTRCQIALNYSNMHNMLSSLDSTIKDNILKHMDEESETFLTFLENEYNIGNKFICPSRIKDKPTCNLILKTFPELCTQGQGDTYEIAKEMAFKNLCQLIKELLD